MVAQIDSDTKKYFTIKWTRMFINADVIFSIGSGTCENMIQLGYNIGEIKPVAQF